jgi:hypothetical protein
VKLKINLGTQRELYENADKIVYDVARSVLDYTGSLKATAYKTGRMERTMYERGVQPITDGYQIGNYTTYAERVYKLDRANWTNPLTQPHWYNAIWKKYGGQIINEVVGRYKV